MVGKPMIISQRYLCFPILVYISLKNLRNSFSHSLTPQQAAENRSADRQRVRYSQCANKIHYNTLNRLDH